MFNNLSKYKKIYFIGIGGISMSALAKLLVIKGHIVCGSDILLDNKREELLDYNINVFDSPCYSEIDNSDLVCYTGAIREDDVERLYAIKQGKDTMERSTLLGLISQNYNNVIAVSGSHGKTTITSLIGYAFMLAGLNPTIHVGGRVGAFGGNILVGDNSYFITEACEYRDSFLSFSPNVSVVNNIDREHLDYFKSFDNEVNSFKKFITNTKCMSFVHSSIKLSQVDNKIIYYSSDSVEQKAYHYVAKNISINKDGKYSFDVFFDGDFVYRFRLNIFGKHNIDNALSAIAVCKYYGIDNKVIYKALSTFKQVENRFEKIGEWQDAPIICDYAHHPSEILATYNTCKEVYRGKKVVCIFQPHTYSRTKALLHDFVSALSLFDTLIILPTYSARENYDYFGSARRLFNLIKKNKQNTYYCSQGRLTYMVKKLSSTDVIFLFVGAGDVNKFARSLLQI